MRVSGVPMGPKLCISSTPKDIKDIWSFLGLRTIIDGLSRIFWLLWFENSVVYGHPAHLLMSSQARTFALGTCQEETVIGSLSVKDSSENMIG